MNRWFSAAGRKQPPEDKLLLPPTPAVSGILVGETPLSQDEIEYRI